MRSVDLRGLANFLSPPFYKMHSKFAIKMRKSLRKKIIVGLSLSR